MADKLVSVIIPTYNRQDTIKRAVDSVLGQTYAALEVIVVDDGSSDDTVDIIKRYTDARVRLVCQEHGGADKARNIGIRQSDGAYIAFQDSDDEWLPEKLEMQVKLMEESGYRACYCPYYLHEDGAVCTVPSDYIDMDKYHAGLHAILAVRNVVSTQTLIVKREVLDMLGDEFFDEHMSRWQDYEFAVRLSQCAEMGYLAQPLVNVYHSEVSISSDRKVLYTAVARMIRKHADFLEIRQFLGGFIRDYDILADIGVDIINGLNLIQAALDDACPGAGVNIKDMLITDLARQKAAHRTVERKEYACHIGALQNKNFIIYGAGKKGREVYQKLKMKGLSPRCFLVTRCERTEYIDDIPVISITKNNDRDITVIVAVSGEWQDELKEKLIDYGYSSYFVYQGTV